jgi:hypothetical protein
MFASREINATQDLASCSEPAFSDDNPALQWNEPLCSGHHWGMKVLAGDLISFPIYGVAVGTKISGHCREGGR